MLYIDYVISYFFVIWVINNKLSYAYFQFIIQQFEDYNHVIK